MKLIRGTKYRIYPTPEQEERLLAWESSLRWLWNLALEQRYMQLSRAAVPSESRGMVRYRGEWFRMKRMSKQLTALCTVDDRIIDVPRHAKGYIFDRLDKAWDRYWKAPLRRPLWVRMPKSPEARKAFKERWKGCQGAPRFKRHDDSVSLCETDAKGFAIGSVWIRFPKLGRIRAVIHRDPLGKPKRCELAREGRRWFASVICEDIVPDPTGRDIPTVGIDRGISLLIADSNGRSILRPDWIDRLNKQIARAQRQASRKQKGSANQRKAYERVAELKRRKKRKLDDLLHKESAYYAEHYGVVVVEDLQVGNMTASAKGSPENPGKNVAQKAGLNRAILESGWGRFVTMLEYKLAERGGRLVKVPPHYTSQRCSACGHTEAGNRPSQAKFLCQSCGHAENADVNAAKNIENRYTVGELPAVLPVEDPPLGAQRSRKYTVKTI